MFNILYKAEAYFRMGNIDEAEKHNEQGVQLAYKQQDDAQIFFSNLLRAKIAAARGQQKEAKIVLEQLLPEAVDNDEFTGLVYYELWKTCDDCSYAEKSLRIYKKIYTKIQTFAIRDKVEELEAALNSNSL